MFARSLGLGLLCFLSVNGLQGQNPTRTDEATALLQRRAEEERYKILRSSMDAMQDALVAQQQRIQELTEQIQSKLSDVERDQNQFVTRAEFEKLADAIKELDKKRMADRELFLKELRSLATTLKSPPTTSGGKESAPPPPKAFESFYEYEVQSGDNLFLIVKTYNDEVFKSQGVSISVKDVEASNPGLNAALIRPGDLIKIPIPGK